MRTKKDAQHTVKASIGNVTIYLTPERVKQIRNLQKIIKEQKEKEGKK